MKDPLRQEISNALLRPLDGNMFERCARGLLGDVFPNLARVPGGSDAGYDGALVHADKPRTPLVCTVSPYTAARANLKRSLSRVRGCSGSEADTAFLASPQAFTPPQKRSLEKAAQSLGFGTLEIFDHEWFVDQLYLDDSWRKELLGIAGRPCALSPAPLRRRVGISIPLVGRQKELDTLRALEGDAVLWGQPGVGKTFLLEHLCKEEWAYFLVDNDQENLANAIRRLSPRRVIIDDVHFRAESVDQLRHLRESIGQHYDIVATTWPGRKDEIASLLGSAQTIEIPLLSRDEIAAIVVGAGIRSPRELIQEIVLQARGRAGLTAMLTQLCLAGGALEVARGDRLLAETVGTYRDLLLRKDSALALSVISLSGDSGIDTSSLKAILEVP